MQNYILQYIPPNRVARCTECVGHRYQMGVSVDTYPATVTRQSEEARGGGGRILSTDEIVTN